MIKVAVAGALGQMGRRIIALLPETKEMALACAIDAPGTAGMGNPLQTIVPEAPSGVLLEPEYDGGCDVVIDFSFHSASAALAAKMIGFRTPLVIGTTGLTREEMTVIDEAALEIPIFVSPNMSVGANLLFDTAARMARSLGADFDIEIVEAHHRFKKDAPSGTALELARRIADARGLTSDNFIYGRHGETGARPQDQIAIHTLRGGDIVGEHTAIFTSLGERLEITHRAHTRDCFARGALRVARWVLSQGPGKYTMKDFLGA